MKRWMPIFPLVVLSLLAFAAPLHAENEGLDDLDKATEAKLNAQSLDDLTEVVNLLDAALKKGLDKENTEFAEKLLASTLTGRAAIVAGAFLDQPQVDPRWPQLWALAVADLERALRLDQELLEAHYLMGRLQALPDGDHDRAKKSLTKVIDADEIALDQRIKALTARAALHEKPEDQLADFNRAVELAPDNADVLRARGLYYMLREQPKEALPDLKKATEVAPDNASSFEALGMAQFLSEDLEAALASFDKAIELAPESPTAYLQRARVFIVRNELPEAIKNLDQALKLNPQALAVLLLRARVHAQAGDVEKALADVEEAAKTRQGKVPALELKADILAATDKLDEAIKQLEELTAQLPTNSELAMKLGMFYVANDQPRKGIERFTAVLEANDQNWQALRNRGDAYLSIAQQAAAIKDYNAAVKIQPEDDGLLNNLAWVLATSPDDALRDGKRALELALKAAELSEYKKGFILSTLAAAYAETGDFEKAKEWSEKAIANGREAELVQLKQELESYKEKKPWREVQNVEEKGATVEEKKPQKAPARTADF